MTHKPRKYYLHNEYHLGDNVFNMIYFNIISSYIKKNDFMIYYYCQPCYIDQVKEFITCENVVINDIAIKPNYSIQLWINNNWFGYTNDIEYQKAIDKNTTRIDYNRFFLKFFNRVLSKLKMGIKIKGFYYKDNDLFTRFYNIASKFGDKYANVDLLILNSQPYSGQYSYNKTEWDNYIIFLNKKYKVVTTTKVDGISCTLDDELTIKDIASMSMNVKIIIAVNSGVVPGCLNKYTLQNIKQVFIFDDRCYFSYPKFQNKEKITDITCAELDKYLQKW